MVYKLFLTVPKYVAAMILGNSIRTNNFDFVFYIISALLIGHIILDIQRLYLLELQENLIEVKKEKS